MPPGVYPQDEWNPEEADPFLIADDTEDPKGSRNRTWYYRWVTVTAVDAAGTPLPETSIEVNLDEDYKNVSEALYENVQNKNLFYNNIEAWEYMNSTWEEYYDMEEDEFITDENGQVTLFLVSDRVNHPQDWPNTRNVGDYYINGNHPDMGDDAYGELSLKSFPRMNESSTFLDFELSFDDEIPLPDFDVTDEDLRILEDGQEVNFVNPGASLDLELDVTNDGDSDVGDDIDVGFYLDDQDPDNLIGTDTIGGLAIGDTDTASVVFDTTDVEPQDYDILAVVDPDEEYEEQDAENNIANKDLTISERANLQPTEIIPDPGYTITYGEDLALRAGVENIGGMDADNVNVSFYYDENDYIGSDRVDLPGNGTIDYTEYIPWEDYPDPGEYTVTVEVDPENEIEESNETNNNLSETFTILSQANLTIDHMNVDPSNVYGGDVVNIEGQISNNGESPSSDINVHFYLDEGTQSEEVIYSESLPGLGGDESAIIEYDWTAEMAFDELNETRTITMLVEPAIEDEIQQSADIEIMKPADISVSEDDITFSTELSQKDETLQISAIVQNLGGAGTVVDVKFYEGFPEDENLIGTHDDIDMAPDSSENLQVNWTPEIRGNREIHVIADYDDDEVDGEDNHAMVVKPIFSVDYSDDLIVGGEGFPNEREITGSYDREGFVVIQGNGELRITGSNPRAVFGLIMDSDHRYSVMLRDQGSLEIDHGSIQSDYQFDIQLEDDSELVVKGDSMMPNNINIIAEDESSVQIDDTSVEGSMEITGDSFSAKESQFTSSDIFLQPSNVDIVNSTFEADLVDFHDTSGTLTGVETGAVEATGESEIELYRWVRATALSQTGLTIQGAEITAENIDVDYSVTGRTGAQGIAYLRVYTDLISDDGDDPDGNYEFSAEYIPEGTDQVYEIEPFKESLPNYPSQEYVIDYDMHFEDLAIPDLSINEDDIYIGSEKISLGDEVWIEADIENVGETEAQEVDVYFYRVYDGQDDEQIGMDTLDSVSTEASTTARVRWTADMVDEMQTSEDVGIRVYVDPGVEPLPDPNLDNNEAARSFTVNSLPSLEFDSEIVLLRDGVELTEDDEIVEYDDITINITLANTGGTDLINGTVNIAVSGSELVEDNIDVESGDTLVYSYEWLVTQNGEQQIEIWYNSSEEDQVSSAYIDRTIDIETMVLRYTDVRLIDSEESGEDKIVEGTLERDDGKAVAGIDVTAYLMDGDEVATQSTETTGDDGKFNIFIPEPANDGTYSLSLEADYPGSEMEDTGESIEIGEPDAGIPLWMIIAVIGAIAAGSVGGIFAYIKIQGPSEWVECGNCGTTIPADVKECPECGVEFETETVKCSECGDWIPADSDECPNCGSTFIKTGKEVQDYEQTMKQQYERYVDKQRNKAKAELGSDFTEEEFMAWWQEQPSYITFDEWIEREEARRKEGGIECPECGALNSVDDAICQKCGSTLISVGEESEEDLDIDLSETDETLGLEIDSEGEGPEEDFSEIPVSEIPEETEEAETESEKDKVVQKKVKKKPKKVVKKKVKKKPKRDKDEDEEK
ncbi:MAG: CARDB domain-containing protein [Candidatus Saliniplasma sp.]